MLVTAIHKGRTRASLEGEGTVPGKQFKGFGRVEADALDLLILQRMVEDARTPFTELASTTANDPRTIINRYQRLVQDGVIRKTTLDIDWARLGLGAYAFIGSTTALGKQDRDKLLEFLNNEPRIIEAEATIGGHEYIMRAIDSDLASLRENVLFPLEPLTVDLTTSISSWNIKPSSPAALLGFIREKKLGKC